MSGMDRILRGGTLVLPDGEAPADLAIRDGRIAALLSPGSQIDAREEIDVTGKHVLPGAIDIHFHVRAPAYPARGTVESETRAAAAGGVTTIMEMPISKPCCATPQVFRDRRQHFAEQAHVHFGLYAAPGMLDPKGVQEMSDEGAIAFKIFMTEAPAGRDDEFVGLCVPQASAQYESLRLVRETGRLLVAHAEDNDLLTYFTERLRKAGRTDHLAHGESRPPVVEATAIASLLTMNEDIGAAVHIAHVSSRHALDVIRSFRATGMDLSAETCPHYLQFDESVLGDYGPFAKINPPIRTKDDQQALWQGIHDGTLSSVTTDHSPFTFEEKEQARGDILSAPPGAPGVEHLLIGMLDAAIRGEITLQKAVELVSTNGAKRFGIASRKGVIRPGADADLVVVDLKGTTRTEQEDLHTASRKTDRLYSGREYRGAIERTLLMGQVIFEGGKVLNAPGDGRFLRPD